MKKILIISSLTLSMLISSDISGVSYFEFEDSFSLNRTYLTYKKDVSDYRESSALKVFKELYFKGTKVDGIYDKDPVKNSDAIKISEISYSDYLNKEIKVMDATAISLAKDRTLPIIIFSILNTSNILEILDGKGSYSIIE